MDAAIVVVVLGLVLAHGPQTSPAAELWYGTEDRLVRALLQVTKDSIDEVDSSTAYNLDSDIFVVSATPDFGDNNSVIRTWVATTSTSFNESTLISIDSESHRNSVAESLPPSEYVRVDSSRATAWFVSNKAKSVFNLRLNKPEVNNVVRYKDTERPRALAVDPCRGHAYWLVWSSSGTRIERSSSDSSVNVLITLEFKIFALTFDVDEDRLLWIGQPDSGGIIIGSLNMSTKELEIICQNERVDHVPFDLTVDKSIIVWSDWKNRAIWGLVNNGEHICKPQLVNRLESSRPLGVNFAANTHKSCAKSNNLEVISKDNSDVEDTSVIEVDGKEDQTHFSVPKDLNKDLDSATFSVCSPDFCLNKGVCHVSKKKGRRCECPKGFEGERCERDRCFQRCLNNGQCNVLSIGQIECECEKSFVGPRCEISLVDDLDLENKVISGLLLGMVLVAFVFVMGCLLALLCCRGASGPKVRKLDRQIYVHQSTEENGCYDNIIKDKSDVAVHEKRDKTCGMDPRNGVLVDLEDCCQMTLCNEPCLDAVLYRKGSRLPRHRSTSAKSNASVEDDKKRLIQS